MSAQRINSWGQTNSRKPPQQINLSKCNNDNTSVNFTITSLKFGLVVIHKTKSKFYLNIATLQEIVKKIFSRFDYKDNLVIT